MALPKNSLQWIKGGFLLIGGAALVITGLWIGISNLGFLYQAKRAPGIVSEIVGERSVRGTILYRPVVRFQPDGNGGHIVFKAKPGLWPSPFDTGDRVVVAYAEDNPDNAKIVSFWMLWFLPGVTALFGWACLFAGRSIMRKIA